MILAVVDADDLVDPSVVDLMDFLNQRSAVDGRDYGRGCRTENGLGLVTVRPEDVGAGRSVLRRVVVPPESLVPEEFLFDESFQPFCFIGD